MLFNSFEFAVFLPVVFLIYWFALQKHLKLQNLFIVAVSYLFYGWWDWRFLLLIAFTTFCSYLSGVLIQKSDNKEVTPPLHCRNYAKWIATANIVLNLAILCLFKYFNFFSENLAQLFRLFGAELDWVTLDILLPVGISFYTFQALSYTIDVYKKKIEPTHDVVSFFAYVSFFPQLVAGPIERATNLLPQFYKSRTFDYAKAVDGMRQILWGLFKKIVVADNAATAVNEIFNNYSDLNGSTLLLGGVLFAFQIYGDFSGYSDIAIGTARLFGIDLMRNFNFPYFSRDIAEFWRRWHISLNTWFRDYIYIPLGGSRRGTKIAIRNTFVIFLVSGFWHGANWTFIAWGAFHAVLFLPLLLLKKNRKFTDTVAQSRWYPTVGELLNMGVTFFLVVIGWIIFRSDNITQAYDYLSHMFSASFFTMPVLMGKKALLFIVMLVVVEWVGRRNQHA
ncbi:MAG: MBOAT family O-acyltransferase, partial [Mucinivorans sp.]